MCLTTVTSVHITPLPEKRIGYKLLSETKEPDILKSMFTNREYKIGEQYTAAPSYSNRLLGNVDDNGWISGEDGKAYYAGFHIYKTLKIGINKNTPYENCVIAKVEYCDIVAEGYIHNGLFSEDIDVAQTMTVIEVLPNGN